ncbi:sigma-54 interaction domain-containing protein [Natronincola ferrireducens]|uniref:Transcriptional regulator containing PAS, AAA-type ATPase, and DNA-binding Fis domains n=1 Tax=Natronincola ferrireducens TaxID=393762 RepID=A0A1G9IX30_9FIRM|nr:sigma 54-interacting transcriptional regulator [Natronincola ferrireducens]SDL29790.1 Transcriptional regulator containing PAS, AAA-type ATPase, and DNA-binding Fis domains [Natronincola ferrireducens]
MSYLRLVQDKIQDLSEAVSSALNIEVTVVDENLVRIAGTGDFYHTINENSPENSLFADVLISGEPRINIIKKDNDICKSCKNFIGCNEKRNITYPIKVENKTIGVVSFASFNLEQDKLMNEKTQQFVGMLKHIAEMIEQEIVSIKGINKLKVSSAEINEIINCINMGIIIIDSNQHITQINKKAINLLEINFSDKRVIDKNIVKIIQNFFIDNTKNKELITTWKVNEKNIKVSYNYDDILLDKNTKAKVISFSRLQNTTGIDLDDDNTNKITFQHIVGRSPSLLEAVNKAKIAAQSESTILIQGPSGTGKELFARSIHNESARRNKPFIAVNCSSIPENLIESELFGYEKGSFTGANTKGKLGKFELANNGTLFLDEIGDLPLHLQPKLLRVLQEKKIDRIGGAQPVDINVRIISATHKNLEDLIKYKNFRIDLFYRLNVIPLNLPPLNERGSDILLCAEYILKKLCNNMNKEPKVLAKDVQEKFMTYDWPGNLRELENVLEYAVNYSYHETITSNDLPDYFLKGALCEPINIETLSEKGLEDLTIEFEKNIIKKYIDIYGNTTEGKKKAAKKLKIGLTTLYRKLNDYNLNRVGEK